MKAWGVKSLGKRSPPRFEFHVSSGGDRRRLEILRQETEKGYGVSLRRHTITSIQIRDVLCPALPVRVSRIVSVVW